jgi:uncharacterized membrane protein
VKPVLPVLCSYALSFVFVGIYWNNHHHLFQAAERITGATLWANLHLLFWLSLIPFVTDWIGESHFAPAPIALYGVVLFLAAISYTILQITLLRAPGGNPLLAQSLGRDLKGKVSLTLYAAAIGLSFVNRWIALALYIVVALIWFLPDPRIERTVHEYNPPEQQ